MALTEEQKRIVYNIIKLEGTSNGANEYLWLAHTANNEAKHRGITMYDLLLTGYSSVPKSEKTELPDTNVSANAKAARAGVDSGSKL